MSANNRDWAIVAAEALLSVSCLFIIFQEKNIVPYWALWPPFSVFVGAAFGCYWDGWSPTKNYQINQFVSYLRMANIGFVIASTTQVTNRLFSSDYDEFVNSFVTGFIVINLSLNYFLGNTPILCLAFVTLANLYSLVVTYNSPNPGSFEFFWFTFINLICAFLIVIPKYGSVIFHVGTSIGNIFLYIGLMKVTPTFSEVEHSTDKTALFIGLLVGYIGVISFPLQKSELRFRVIGVLWDLVMAFLLKTPFDLPPPPATPKDGYKQLVTWVPYFVNNPRSAPLIVPSASFVPPNQRYKYNLLTQAFRIIGLLDQYLPTADEQVPLVDKARLQATNTISEFWPLSFYLLKMEPFLQEEENVRKTSEVGRFLEWQTNKNTHIYRYLRLANDTEKGQCPEVTHVLDLTFLEQYEPKKDYYPYGGKAFYKIKGVIDGRNIFELIGLIEPRDNLQRLLLVKSSNPLYKIVENQIFATLSFLNVVFCHLLEIHTMCNTVSVSLYNAFDVNCQKVHGFRAVLQLHFSNHTEVQEVTTAHLLNKGGIFEQVFAYPHDTLINILNEQFKSYEYAYDSDWERRRSLVGDLGWEEVYRNILNDYGTDVANAIWETDKDVEHDMVMQKFYENLNSVLPNGVPKRFGRLDTKDRVALFIADTIHIVVIRHEVYGTKIPTYSVYNDLTGLSQAPKDNLPFAKENYLSLVQITVGTSMKSFPKLIPDPVTHYNVTVDHFKTLVKDIPEQEIQIKLVNAFAKFQGTLVQLDNDWKSKGSWATDELVCLPSDLEIGAGY